LRPTLFFATEADLLNKALFGMTAKEWRDKNPQLEGNLRDYADGHNEKNGWLKS
jgi:hypothetical protein